MAKTAVHNELATQLYCLKPSWYGTLLSFCWCSFCKHVHTGYWTKVLGLVVGVKLCDPNPRWGMQTKSPTIQLTRVNTSMTRALPLETRFVRVAIQRVLHWLMSGRLLACSYGWIVHGRDAPSIVHAAPDDSTPIPHSRLSNFLVLGC